MSRETSAAFREIFQETFTLDRVVHEPSRLAVLSCLRVAGETAFMSLAKITGLSRGNLTLQLDKLKEEGLVETQRVIHHRKSLTTVWLTSNGEERLESYLDTMQRLVEITRYTSIFDQPPTTSELSRQYRFREEHTNG